MQIGWVDFSKTERDKVVSILRLLGTQTALDELGIGTVRDAFSDMLFPGISTLQTRAICHQTQLIWSNGKAGSTVISAMRSVRTWQTANSELSHLKRAFGRRPWIVRQWP